MSQIPMMIRKQKAGRCQIRLISRPEKKRKKQKRTENERIVGEVSFINIFAREMSGEGEVKNATKKITA